MIEDPNYKIMIELLGNSVQEEVILLNGYQRFKIDVCEGAKRITKKYSQNQKFMFTI